MYRPILFCGGGSLGHLVPSLAIAQSVETLAPGTPVLFVCANRTEETEFLRQANQPYRAIAAGKFPRGFTIRWITFPALTLIALGQSLSILLKEKPQLIFSKGGYVSVPVCLIGALLRIPIVLHESDSLMGMSNRFLSRFATTICMGFSVKISDSRMVVTGNPVREMIAKGSKDAGKRITGFSGRKPVILFIGGSQGSQAINDAVEHQLEQLLLIGDIVHLTGQGKMTKRKHAHYWARELVTDELPHLYALADVVVSRAGASALSELAAIGKPVIVIPLRGVAQDHQQSNALGLEILQAILLLPQTRIDQLSETISKLLTDDTKRAALGKRLKEAFPASASAAIARILLDVCRKTV